MGSNVVLDPTNYNFMDKNSSSTYCQRPQLTLQKLT